MGYHMFAIMVFVSGEILLGSIAFICYGLGRLLPFLGGAALQWLSRLCTVSASRRDGYRLSWAIHRGVSLLALAVLLTLGMAASVA